MTLELPRFLCFFGCWQLRKDTENGAAVTSLRSFLFRNDFRRSEMNVEVCEEFSHVFRKHVLKTTVAFSIFAISIQVDVIDRTYFFVKSDEKLPYGLTRQTEAGGIRIQLFVVSQFAMIFRFLKFIYSEKATKFCEIFP